MFRSRRGFTLIELLIVIAIILILIAIALPNFLEAQIRARVAKAKGEIRSLVTAMESYALDWHVYPAESEDNALVPGARLRREAGLTWLTSPIAYIKTLPEDPFPGSDAQIVTYETGGVETIRADIALTGALEMYAIYSRGPDAPAEEVKSRSPNYLVPGDGIVNTYSPTNGTKSQGDIFHYGGDGWYVGVQIEAANKAQSKTAPMPGLNVDGIVYLHRLPPGLF